MVARYMGKQEDTYLGRGKVYRIRVEYPEYGFWDKLMASFAHSPLPVVEIWTTNKEGRLDNHTQYFSVEDFDNDWKIERNKFFRNVKRGI